MGMNRQRGFTLLEVLIAGFILFLVISSMTLVYRGAVLSSSKAESAIKFTAAIPSIKQLISSEIREGGLRQNRSGRGTYGTIDYSWSGIATHKGTYLSPDNSDDRSYYYLMTVELNVTNGSAIRDYSFSELIW
jgi:prepilin-type N-terminal cleavage/methylation domain-containing protein